MQSADNKNTMMARKLKEQHAIEQAKLEAIENKIEKARKKMEQNKIQKSRIAMDTRVKFGLKGGEEDNNEGGADDFLY